MSLGGRFRGQGGVQGVRLGAGMLCLCRWAAGARPEVRLGGTDTKQTGLRQRTNDGSLFSDINAAPQPSFISTIFTIFITSTVTSSTSSSESVWSRKPLYSTYLNIATFSSHIKKSCSYVYCEILHVYVCMYACTYACLMYVGVYVRMCLCMCVMYVGMHAHTYACMYL